MTDAAPTTTSPIDAVRAATRAMHADLERHVEGARLLRGPFDLEHYRRFLVAHEGFLRLRRSWAARGHASGAAALEGGSDARHTAIESDLAALDVARRIADERLDRFAPAAGGSPASALGFVYVADGSCHGNTHILRALEQDPAFRTLGASRFLGSCAAALAERWPALLATMDRVAPSDVAGLIDGAELGFRAFRAIWDDA